jgi:hypothetical protein
MGKEKGRNSCCQNCKKKGGNYCCGKEKAFTADEGAVGGKKENRKEVNIVKRPSAISWSSFRQEALHAEAYSGWEKPAKWPV